jgi:hypothetical protein
MIALKQLFMPCDAVWSDQCGRLLIIFRNRYGFAFNECFWNCNLFFAVGQRLQIVDNFSRLFCGDREARHFGNNLIFSWSNLSRVAGSISYMSGGYGVAGASAKVVIEFCSFLTACCFLRWLDKEKLGRNHFLIP